MTISILLADDQPMIRSAYGMILGSQPDMEIVASVADGDSALREARRLRPDVCLLDIRMPGPDGLEVTRLLAGPGVPDPLNVLIATTFDLDTYVYRALRDGARGFLLKDGSRRCSSRRSAPWPPTTPSSHPRSPYGSCGTWPVRYPNRNPTSHLPPTGARPTTPAPR